MQTEKKIICVSAYTCMADYTILHKRVCYLLYIKKKKKKKGVMGLCHPSDITTINMSCVI